MQRQAPVTINVQSNRASRSIARRTPRAEPRDELRAYVARILAERAYLEVGAFPMTERALIQRGRACGILFCLHGPRSVKLSAIWSADQDAVLFYDTDGTRFGKAARPGIQAA